LKKTHIERFYNMIYLNEDCIGHIVSFLNENMKYKSIEEVFMCLTCKYLRYVVKTYSSIKELTNEEHTCAVEQYYYASMYNMKMIHELEALNMRSIPLHSFPSFLIRISENVVMLKYFYDNPLYGVNKDIRIKIRFNRKIVKFLFDFGTNPESLTFLQELRRLYVLIITEDNNDYILNMITTEIIMKAIKSEEYYHNQLLNLFHNSRLNDIPDL
jgi:hypothetical protein